MDDALDVSDQYQNLAHGLREGGSRLDLKEKSKILLGYFTITFIVNFN